jgi:hypothetical protein
MPERRQIFHPSTNAVARGSILALVLLLGAAAWTAVFVDRSPYTTYVGVVHTQPVPFSHQHHVEMLGIDCRYCHTTVEHSPFAGIPPTETCLNCHAQIWADAPMLAPLYESMEQNRPLEWTRVHDLPDYVYFDHSIHVAKGIGCVTCHGRVDKMPLTWKVETMHMDWCLDCHRAPEKYIRPHEFVFDLSWEPEEDQMTLGRRLVEEYDVRTFGLTDCWICHR